MTWRDAIPWDVIAFIAKTIASVGIGVIAALKLGRRASVWIAGPRVETTLRTMFAKEIAKLDTACEKAGACAHWQEVSVSRLDRFDQRLDAIDRDMGIVAEMVSDNSEFLEEQSGLMDTILGIERRGTDRTKALSELRERAIKRRAERRINGHIRPAAAPTEAPEGPPAPV